MHNIINDNHSRYKKVVYKNSIEYRDNKLDKEELMIDVLQEKIVVL
ncbi:MAG: hypothetical protein PV340_01010 [Wolbachia sp.]|nr:hypothetical protein [Wolbachia sp.]MDD9336193.1 hypothetical protein [Wolbachia sp.]